MIQPKRQQSVLDLIKGLHGLDPLKQLFWSELNYERINQPLSRRGLADTAAKALAEDPVLFASGGYGNAFHVIYARLASDRLLLSHERPIVSWLLQDHPYVLFIFSNSTQNRWHFLNVKYDNKTDKRRLFRRITIGPEERLRTASERLTLLDLASISPNLSDLSPLDIQNCHDEAFDVEAVTKQFFEEYKAVFGILQNDLTRQTKDRHWAHDYALQFLNRCMFLYFIQRKRWLGEDTEFLRSFWESYRSAGQPKDSFFERWLKVLFLEAFNNKFHDGHRHFPDKIKRALALAPYLNGGLFTQNNLDQKFSFTITDTRFDQVFTFLERYNFTIAEDSPLDQEVAVDPEMIGKVYESLVNVSTEADERADAGIFYTPRTEIDLMCRLALVDHLANYLEPKHKNLLYEAIFALEQDEKVAADRGWAEAKLWPALDARLHEITVVDPACGSGSFLVGMLHILDDLQARAAVQLGTSESPYDRKKRIIGQNLYGVDVMEWACHVAELRLWLALIIDAEFPKEELHIRREPLLPYFAFKIRCGDSLVQEIGGIDLGYIRGSRDILSGLKARITRLKTEKLKFYNNDPTCKFRSADQVIQEELRLFRDILDARYHAVEEEIKTLRRKIKGVGERQIRSDRTVEEQPYQTESEIAAWQQQIEELTSELDRINHARAALKTARDVPFVWDIGFVEVFEGDRGGFDIVIGNPPYVRQENISDPHLPREDVTTENKKAYKTKLARSVYQNFPHFFGYKLLKDTASHKLDAKSDLYVYFYFHGLSLLNPKGSFCFITSNSWLDVGYGADLQEFLLKHCHMKMILDNQVRRSFASADVNTVICLFSVPDEKMKTTYASPSQNTARFVMFKAPFEHILSPVIFEEIEETKERKTTQEYRIYPISQRALLEDGWEWPEDVTEEAKKRFGYALKGSKYGGNKWGGKYLRAPDIYWTILEKGKGKLVRLGDIAEVRFGIKTGANEFFYLDKAKIREWGIEEEFLRPVIKSPRECKRILIDLRDLKFKIFMCRKDKEELRGTAALEYIKWGEQSRKDKNDQEIGKFHERPSCAGRARWWEAPDEKGNTFWGKEIRERIATFCSTRPMYADCRLYIAETEPWLQAVLNSTLTAFISEAMARNLGGGGGPRSMMVYEVQNLLTVSKHAITDNEVELIALLKNMGSNYVQPFINEVRNPHRHALDNIIFDSLSLTQGERDAVYEAVINLVKARLNKASSLSPKGRHKRIEAAEKTRGIWAGLPEEEDDEDQEE
ncbi:MAG: Eco57I restriction-modification methylase domain-containing protein [Candidatus Tectomicrobia bacterium]|nr:Eco57I restriction-modification methylase domain-containing protein [Candidatus Tectomicrobia bacterium]